MLISELDVGDPVPLQSQIARITDNEKIGINISNRGRRTLIIEKTGTSLALELSTNLRFAVPNCTSTFKRFQQGEGPSQKY